MFRHHRRRAIARNRIDRVTTRSGDAGATSLADGRRYAKHHVAIEVVGALDEANSFLGLLAASTTEFGEELALVQSRLFDAGAAVAIGDSAVDWEAETWRIEETTERLNEPLKPLTEFILPGGGEAAARCHVARTAVRRAERRFWRLSEDKPALAETGIGAWLNRVSDLLFVMARQLAEEERLWQPATAKTDQDPDKSKGT